MYFIFQLLNGRVEDDEIPEEYCGLEGSTPQEQLTIVSSRLDQREADYDSLKTELNKTKEECINLQGNLELAHILAAISRWELRNGAV